MDERNITLSVKVSAPERKALRIAAAQRDCDVQSLIRAVARQLEEGTIDPVVTDADKGQKTGPKPKAKKEESA